MYCKNEVTFSLKEFCSQSPFQLLDVHFLMIFMNKQIADNSKLITNNFERMNQQSTYSEAVVGGSISEFLPDS